MKNLLYILLFALGLFSCQKEVDNESPQLQVQFLSSRSQLAVVCDSTNLETVYFDYLGDSLKFKIRVSDNQMLSQYKIDIHDNFDCHGHKSLINWQYYLIQDLNTKDSLIEIKIPLPLSVSAGLYHLQCRTVDQSGNESDLGQFFNLYLIHPDDSIAPQIQINAPLSNSIAIRGQNLRFTANISDNQSLDGGKIQIFVYTPSGNRVVVLSQDLPNPQGNQYNLDYFYTLPTTFVSGNYEFILSVKDAKGNEKRTDFIPVYLN